MTVTPGPTSRPLLGTHLHTYVDTPHHSPPSCTGPQWSHLEAEHVLGRVTWEGAGCLGGELGWKGRGGVGSHCHHRQGGSVALRLVALGLSIKGVGWMLVGATHASRVRPSAGLHVGCIRHAGVLAGIHVVLGEEGRVGANLVPLEG